MCPEESSVAWEYWSDDNQEWIDDATVAAECDGDICCNDIVISSSGEANDKQQTRLGHYVKSFSSNNGRFTYQKVDETNLFLYWLKSYNGVWMVCCVQFLR